MRTSEMQRDDERFYELAELVCDNTITPDEIDELQQLVLKDKSRQHALIDYCQTHSGLLQELKSEHAANVAQNLMWDDTEQSVAPARPRSFLRRASRHQLRSSLAVAILGMVALLLTLAVIPASVIFVTDRPEEDGGDVRKVVAQDVATLTRWRRVEWKKGFRISGQNHRLRSGQKVAIESGLAEITYATGARVVLQGPAEFEVTGVNSGYLTLGKLVARVTDERAKHFTVETPVTQVEDLGTEFALDVAADGRTRLHVYEGTVRLGGTGGMPSQVVGAGRSFEVAPDANGSIAAISLDSLGDRFVRSFVAPVDQQTGDRQRPYVLRPAWDSYVSQREPDKSFAEEDRLLVKRAIPDDGWEREAWLSFDLTGVDVARLRNAQLSLTIAPSLTAPRRKSIVEDWRFEVFGLSEEEISVDDAKDVTWETTRDIDGKLVATLSFAGNAPTGRQAVTEGDGLVQFLRDSRDRSVVLVVRRATADRPGVANAFASTELGNVGPVLRLQYDADTTSESK